MASHFRRYAAALLSTSILFGAGPALAQSQSPAQPAQDETLPVYLEADNPFRTWGMAKATSRAEMSGPGTKAAPFSPMNWNTGRPAIAS